MEEARYKIRNFCLNEMDYFLRKNYDGSVATRWAVGSPCRVGSGWHVNGIYVCASKEQREGEERPFEIKISGQNIEQLCNDIERAYSNRGLKKIE